MATIIQIRRDTSIQWILADPILAEGEIGHETNTGRMKFGNGIDLWSLLPYYSGGSLPSGGLAGEILIKDTVIDGDVTWGQPDAGGF